MGPFNQQIKFRIDDDPGARKGMHSFACITPLRSKESQEEMVEWCQEHLTEFVFREPWVIIRDAREAVEFRLRWC